MIVLEGGPGDGVKADVNVCMGDTVRVFHKDEPPMEDGSRRAYDYEPTTEERDGATVCRLVQELIVPADQL